MDKSEFLTKAEDVIDMVKYNEIELEEAKEHLLMLARKFALKIVKEDRAAIVTNLLKKTENKPEDDRSEIELAVLTTDYPEILVFRKFFS